MIDSNFETGDLIKITLFDGKIVYGFALYLKKNKKNQKVFWFYEITCFKRKLFIYENLAKNMIEVISKIT